MRGDPAALLPVLHHLVLGFSRHVAREVQKGGFDLSAKSDQRFVEGAWRALREVFGMRPTLTPQQFLAQGFVERKLLLLTDVAARCVELHENAHEQKHLSELKLSKAAVSSLSQRLHKAVPTHWNGADLEEAPRPRGTAPQAQRAGGGAGEGAARPPAAVDPSAEEPGPAPRAEPPSESFGAHFLSDLVRGTDPFLGPSAGVSTVEAPRPATPGRGKPSEAPPEAPQAPAPESFCEMLDEPAPQTAAPGHAAEATAELLAQLLASQPEWGASWVGPGAVAATAGMEEAEPVEEIAELRAQMAELSAQVERMRQTMEARLTVLEGRFTFLEGAAAGGLVAAGQGGPVPVISRKYSADAYTPAPAPAPAPVLAPPTPEAELPAGGAAGETGGGDDKDAAEGGVLSTLSFISKMKNRFEATEKLLQAM